MQEISYEIIRSFGALSSEKSGWKKELNLVAWNGRAPRFDIRDWAPDHQKMGKGITLDRDEASALKALLETALAENPS